MERIVNHPILTIPQEGEHTFLFNGKPVTGMKGFTIAAALHQAGYPVHSHSVNGRNRSLNCGIGYNFWKDYISGVVELTQCKYPSAGMVFRIHLK